ncbi:hypothetical protein FQA39_LY00767 [Lamprigera yunnana]|nr:hypothetical protein FQA39_LY00767 [Lamprigera yunnana]
MNDADPTLTRLNKSVDPSVWKTIRSSDFDKPAEPKSVSRSPPRQAVHALKNLSSNRAQVHTTNSTNFDTCRKETNLVSLSRILLLWILGCDHRSFCDRKRKIGFNKNCVVNGDDIIRVAEGILENGVTTIIGSFEEDKSFFYRIKNVGITEEKCVLGSYHSEDCVEIVSAITVKHLGWKDSALDGRTEGARPPEDSQEDKYSNPNIISIQLRFQPAASPSKVEGLKLYFIPLPLRKPYLQNPLDGSAPGQYQPTIQPFPDTQQNFDVNLSQPRSQNKSLHPLAISLPQSDESAMESSDTETPEMHDCQTVKQFKKRKRNPNSPINTSPTQHVNTSNKFSVLQQVDGAGTNSKNTASGNKTSTVPKPPAIFIYGVTDYNKMI